MWWRPYAAMFAAQFQLMLQYRAAALAGFATQCWWGAIKVMILAAFYAGGGAARAPMRLEDAITYVWLGQAFLAFLPWNADPQVAEMVRTGAVGYERLRPADTYGLWYARNCANMLARAAPRAGLMVLAAGIVLPLIGFPEWSWRLPASPEAAALFLVSMTAVVALSAAIINIVSLIVVSTLTDRGANTLNASVVNLFSGMVVPLAFFPAPLVPIMRATPFAGIVDTPYRIYFAELTGVEALAGIGLQLAWTLVLALLGRWWMAAAMAKLQVQGG